MPESLVLKGVPATLVISFDTRLNPGTSQVTAGFKFEEDLLPCTQLSNRHLAEKWSEHES